MSSSLILVISVVVLVAAYLIYGRWLAKQWGIDPKRTTPAHYLQDDMDYIPTKSPVLFGHHFASIAGADPINGPIIATIFGWLPVLLWVLIGGIFFGAVQDFSSLFASVRHDGCSIGKVIEENFSKRSKKFFILFAWLSLVLMIAAFADIVASTFNGFGTDIAGEVTRFPNNASTATSSLLFIFISIGFGFYVYRKNMPLGILSVIGIALLCICIGLGLAFPIYLPKPVWFIVLFVYIFIASVTPVWILLQPRDYLNSFLLYGMMASAFLGIFFTNPKIELPAFTGFIVDGKPLFPMLFVMVACGAVSGFHSLVASGTTSKQLNRETDALRIGFGSMLFECALAVAALITVSTSYQGGALPTDTPSIVFASNIAAFGLELGIPSEASYTVISLSISAFALTSLDTAARLARFLFQEFFIDRSTRPDQLSDFQKLLIHPYVSSAITVCTCAGIAFIGYQNLWSMFGSANQLLACIALMAASAWLGRIGKQNKMLLFPMLFLLAVTGSVLCLDIKSAAEKIFIATRNSFIFGSIRLFCSALMLAATLYIAYRGIQLLFHTPHRTKRQ